MHLSASITFMFRELPLLERFGAARAAGFDGVEIQRLAEGDPREMGPAAREAGVEVVLINVSSGDYAVGGDGLSGVPGRESEFRAALEEALEAAALLGAHHVHIGPSRISHGVERGECMRTYLANVRTALTISRATGSSLLIEPMNPIDAPTALIRKSKEALDVIAAIDNPRLGLQLDLYHAAMAGENPVAIYERHRALVRHVQFSDAPGRHEPGTGSLDIQGMIGGIRAAGYRGWLGAEYQPLRDTASSLSWMSSLGATVPA